MKTIYPELFGPVHESDSMFHRYRHDAVSHYRNVGLSAIANLELAIEEGGKSWNDIASCLDMGCGYGRILRHLVRLMPNAIITACDRDPSAVEFCSNQFKVEPLIGGDDFDQLNFPRKYDLIWVGSLLTHLNRFDGENLLGLLTRSLQPAGLLVFTTHGQMAIDALDRYVGPNASNILEKGNRLRQEFRETGFAFYPYYNSTLRQETFNFGLSFHSPEYVGKWLRDATPQLHVLNHLPSAWDKHQDVWVSQVNTLTEENRKAGLLTLLAGREECLLNWIAFLEKVDLPWPTTLYVADNSGSDEFATKLLAGIAKAAKKFSKVLYIPLGKPYQIPPGENYLAFRRHKHIADLYNKVLPLVSEDWLLTVEDDVVPSPTVFSDLARQVDPDIAAIAAAYPSPNMPDYPVYHVLDGSRPYTLKEMREKDPIEVSFTGAGCTLWRQDVIRKVLPLMVASNGRKSDRVVNGWDRVLCKKIKSKGYRMLMDGRIQAEHHINGNIQRLNIITGFHRSGTSCVSGMLYHAGLPMGEQESFLKANDANPRGYFENLEFLRLNNKILGGTPWATGIPEKLDDDLLQELRESSAGITVKDPRFCLTLRYWKQCRDIRKVIIVLRHPDECIQSLVTRRDEAKMSFEWHFEFYMRRLCEALTFRNWCAVKYEDVLSCPEQVLMRLQNYLEYPLDIENGVKFVDDKLKHHRLKEGLNWPDICQKIIKYSR